MNNNFLESTQPPQTPANLAVARSVFVFLALCIILVVLAILILAAVPPVDRDALTHHLAVPKLYLKYGGMVEMPWIEFSYYPMNLDLLYIIPLWLGNDIIPKYIHLGFGLLTAGLIYSYLLRRLGSRTYGLLGSLLFLSLPVVVKLSITVYVDLGLIFFSTAALLQLLRWASDGHRLRHLVCAGIWCGLALGTKYNGLVTFFLLTCMLPILYLRGDTGLPTLFWKLSDGDRLGANSRSSINAVVAAIVFFVSALTVFSPWMIRNFVWTGNPVYPLYNGVFSRLEQDRPPRNSEGKTEEPSNQISNHFIDRRLVFNESLLETLSIPVRIFFQGEDDNPKYFDGRLNPYLLLFPLLAFIGWQRIPRRWRIDSAALAAFAVLYLLYAFVQTDMRIRYVAPIIPPLVILSVLGIHSSAVSIQSRRLNARGARIPIYAVALGVGFFLIPNAGYLVSQFKIVEPVRYLAGEISRDDYIKKFRPEYAAYQYINDRLPLDSRILGLYIGNRRYYCNRHLEFDEGFFRNALASSESPNRLSEMIRERGFSHVFIRQDLYDRYILRNLPIDRRNIFQDWLAAHALELFSGSEYRLLKL